MRGHEIEPGRVLLTRKGPVAHPQQAHHPSWDAAHGDHVAEGHPTLEEALGRAGRVETLGDQGLDQLRSDGVGEPRGGGVRAQGVQQLAQGLQAGLLVLVGREQLAQQTVDVPGPVPRRARARKVRAPAGEGVDEGLQSAQGLGLRTLQVGIGCDGPEQLAVRRQGQTEEQPLEPEGPGVRVLGRQIEPRAHLPVQAPAHPALAHPGAQAREVALVETEAPGDGREREPVEHLGGAQPGGRQAQEAMDRREERVPRHQAPVGDRVGDGRRTPGLAAGPAPGSEDRLHVGGVGLDVRGHDDHVPGLESGQGLEQAEQPVVQDLDLPVGAVAGVDLDRAVVGGEGGTGLGVRLAAVAQPEQIGLDLAEQAALVRRHVGPVHLGLELEEQVLHGHAGAAPGGEQGVAHLEQPGALVASADQLAGPGACPTALVREIGPVLLGGAEQEEMHGYPLAESGQQPGIDRRQGRETEAQDPLGEGPARGFAGIQQGLQPGEQGRAVGRSDLPGQRPPQIRLPAGLGAGLTPVGSGLPGKHQVRPVDQILVEEVGDPAGELETLEVAGLAGEITGRGLETRAREQPRKQGVDPPLEPVRVPVRLTREVVDPIAEQLPDEARREWQLQVRGHPRSQGDPLGQPARHALVLHQDAAR